MEYSFEKTKWLEPDDENGFSPEVVEKMHVEIEDEIRASIQELIISQKNFLGAGMTAEVHFLEHDFKLCYKIIRKIEVLARPDAVENLPPKYREIYDKKKAAEDKEKAKPTFMKNNEGTAVWHVDLFTEASFLARARALDPEGPVKVPRPDASIEINGKEEGDGWEVTDHMEVLLMQAMDAISADDHMRKGIALPEGFEYERFCKQVKDYVVLMHENKLYHRDLHAGNVMIDSTTGNPIIIDFGRSGLSSEEDAYVDEVRPGMKMHFIRDEQMFRDKVEIPLKQYAEYRKLT